MCIYIVWLTVNVGGFLGFIFNLRGNFSCEIVHKNFNPHKFRRTKITVFAKQLTKQDSLMICKLLVICEPCVQL